MKAGDLLGVVLDQEREHAAEAAERLIPVPGTACQDCLPPPRSGSSATDRGGGPSLRPGCRSAAHAGNPSRRLPRRRVRPAGRGGRWCPRPCRLRERRAPSALRAIPACRQSGTELAEPRIVRHHGKLRRGMEHAGGLEQRRDHQRPARMQVLVRSWTTSPIADSASGDRASLSRPCPPIERPRRVRFRSGGGVLRCCLRHGAPA